METFQAILEYVSISYSWGIFPIQDQTGVSCCLRTAGILADTTWKPHSSLKPETQLLHLCINVLGTLVGAFGV